MSGNSQTGVDTAAVRWTDTRRSPEHDVRLNLTSPNVLARKSLGPSLGRTLTPTDGSRSLRYKVVSYYRIILALLLAGNMPRSRSAFLLVCRDKLLGSHGPVITNGLYPYREFYNSQTDHKSSLHMT